MHRLVHRILILLPLVLPLVGPVAAHGEEVVRKHHPWAMFTPEAWREDRIVTEVFDKEGKVVDTGLTEKRTVLTAVDNQSATLCVAESVWMVGKWLDRQEVVVKQGIYGNTNRQKVTIKDLKSTTLTIEGREIPCQVREIRVSDPKGKRVQVSKLYFNNDVKPYILKRETRLQGAEDETVLSETEMVVDALRMPCLIGKKIHTAAHLRAVTKHPRGKSITLAYTSTEIPGGIVHQQTKETDKDGKLVSRRVLVLTDFGLEPPTEKGRRRLFQRRSREPRMRSSRRDAAEQ